MHEIGFIALQIVIQAFKFRAFLCIGDGGHQHVQFGECFIRPAMPYGPFDALQGLCIAVFHCTADMLEFLANVEPVQHTDDLCAMPFEAHDDGPTIGGTIREGCDLRVLRSTLLPSCMEYRGFDRREVIILCREGTAFARNRAMMLINGAETIWAIDDRCKRFEAACGLLLGRNMPSIHLHDQFLGWRGTLLLSGWREICFGEHGSHVVRDLSDVMVVIYPTAMHRELLQIGLGFTVAIQSSLFALQFGEIRMDRRAKNRGRCRSALPMTLRIMALMFLEADCMVRKDRMKIRWCEPFFLELVATPRANVMARIDQLSLHGQDGILHFP